MSELRRIDLNADLGEGAPDEVGLIDLVSSANIACGGHAGNEASMARAAFCCMSRGVAIGAHPGYEDPENFGRRVLALPDAAVADGVMRQLHRFGAVESVGIRHVKLHGALYHHADARTSLAEALIRRVAEFAPGCGFYSSPGGNLAKAAQAAGLQVVVEGFADRRYLADGRLMARNDPNAVITDIAQAVAQAMELATLRCVRAVDGTVRELPAETICVHGDNPQALEILRAVRRALLDDGFEIRAPTLR